MYSTCGGCHSTIYDVTVYRKRQCKALFSCHQPTHVMCSSPFLYLVFAAFHSKHGDDFVQQWV